MASYLNEANIETFKLDRENLDRAIARIERLIKDGNAHRIIVKNAAGQTVIEVPLTVGVVGAALAPVSAAFGAVAATAADFTLQIERVD